MHYKGPLFKWLLSILTLFSLPRMATQRSWTWPYGNDSIKNYLKTAKEEEWLITNVVIGYPYPWAFKCRTTIKDPHVRWRGNLFHQVGLSIWIYLTQLQNIQWRWSNRSEEAWMGPGKVFPWSLAWPWCRSCCSRLESSMRPEGEGGRVTGCRELVKVLGGGDAHAEG